MARKPDSKPNAKSRGLMGLNPVDIFLVAVIVAAIVFIAFRVLKSDKRVDVARPDELVPRTAPVLQGGPKSRAVPRNAQWLLQQMKYVDGATFDSAVASAGLKSQLVDATPGCAQPGSSSTIGVNFLDRDIANRVKRRELNLLLGFKQSRCYRKGTTLQVLLYDSDVNSKFVQLLGEVKIEQLLVIPPEKIPDALVTAMGVTRAEYLEFANFSRPAGLPDMIVRFGEFKATKTPPALPIASFPRAEILTAAAATEMAKRPNVHLLDVRSREEFAATKSLSRAVNVPYKVAPALSNQFSWDITRSQLAGGIFNFMDVVSDRNESVIIVASGPSDARAMYALSDLLALDYRKLYWVYDGLEGPSK